MNRRLVPAEKKRLSYERDGVNLYGENDKASRKAIPRFKAASHRKMRHAERALVDRLGAADNDVVETDLGDATFRGLHPWKQKSPDTRLGVALLIERKGGEALKRGLRGRNLRGAVQSDLSWRQCDLVLAEADKNDE